MGRRSERTSVAVERAGCEREPQSGRELVERLHGWPFCGDGEVVSERGNPKDGRSRSVPEQGCEMPSELRPETRGAKYRSKRRRLERTCGEHEARPRRQE